MARRRKSNYLEGLGYLNVWRGTGTAPVAPGIGYTKGRPPPVPGGIAVGSKFLPGHTVPSYPTIQIGNQVWMSENLKATHYRNGHPIPLTPDPDLWMQKITGGRCAYDNDESNVDTYGYLYNWHAIKDQRGICPEGFHVPRDDEWTELEDYLGGWIVANGKMKECTEGSCPESEYWNSPNTGATNESGFTALPGGYRAAEPINDGGYYNMGYHGYFWSSTEARWWDPPYYYPAQNAWGRRMKYSTAEMNYGIYYKRNGMSVRCVAS